MMTHALEQLAAYEFYQPNDIKTRVVAFENATHRLPDTVVLTLELWRANTNEDVIAALDNLLDCLSSDTGTMLHNFRLERNDWRAATARD